VRKMRGDGYLVVVRLWIYIDVLCCETRPWLRLRLRVLYDYYGTVFATRRHSWHQPECSELITPCLQYSTVHYSPPLVSPVLRESS